MKNYSVTKNYDPVSIRNIEENEERHESPGIINIDLNYTNIKNIHNKAKDYR